MDSVHEMVLENRRISVKCIAETLNISRERVGHTLTNVLDMRKVPARWVSKCLNAAQKHERVATSQAILRHFEADKSSFLGRLETMDDTWLFLYDPETKEQS